MSEFDTHRRDSVSSLEGTPTVVHISDVHGYLRDARSALRTVGETSKFEPVVTTDEDGHLHWAGNDYVLVVNGDMIDRGPANAECLDLVWRLQREAPTGRVRYHIGNHEMGVLLPGIVNWPDAYSTSIDDVARQNFLERVTDGKVTVAFSGYNYTYSHAGSNDSIDVKVLNELLQSAATALQDAVGSGDDEAVQRRIFNKYERLFGIGDGGGRGPGAGILWLDFAHLASTAPRQVVGHSMRERPVRDGNVVCGNIIRMNQGTIGGEGVIVETPDQLIAVQRGRNDDVHTRSM